MKKISMALVSAAFISLGTGSAANAISVTFTDFSDVSNFTFNGSTQQATDNNQPVLRLTNSFYQSSSAFLNDPLTFEADTSFQTTFQFQISNQPGTFDEDGPGADGIAFMLQSQGRNALGGSGGGIGSAGILPSLAVEFDTYRNPEVNDESGNHIGINVNGQVDSVVGQTIPRRLNNREVRQAWIDYDGITNLLEVRLSETLDRPEAAVLSYNVDLSSVLGTSPTYVGFTGSTGAGGGEQDILSWRYENTEPSTDQDTDQSTEVPEPTSLVGLLVIGAFGTGSLLKRLIEMRSQP